MKVAMISLGCAKNLVDSEGLLGRLVEHGDVEIVGDPDGADGVIVNTCGFLQSSRDESESITREMLALKEAGRVKWVAMAGCLVERYGQELQTDFPDVTFLGFDDYQRVEDVVRDADSGGRNAPPPPSHRGAREHQGIHGNRLLLTQESFAYLRISEGCNLKCSFCVIPAIRGAFKSRPIDDIVGEAAALAMTGVRELVVVSQDSTYYGRDDGAFALPTLLRELSAVDGIEWIRLQYMNPAFTTDETLDAIAEIPAVVPYMDIPIQHAADATLKRMRRAPGTDGIRRCLLAARDRIPGLTLRTTVMVGFPGETDGEFGEMLDFLDEIRFDRLGCFRFSPEPGSFAIDLPNPVDDETKEARFHALMERQSAITKQSQQARVGQVLPVMVDLPDAGEDGWAIGRTAGDSPEVDCVVLLEGDGWTRGGPVPVEIIDRHEFDLIGRAAGDAR